MKKCVSVVLALLGVVFIGTSTAKASPTELTLPVGYVGFIANGGSALAAMDLSIGGGVVVLKETIDPVNLLEFGSRLVSQPVCALKNCLGGPLEVRFRDGESALAAPNSFARSDRITELHSANRLAQTGWYENYTALASGEAAGSDRSKGAILFGSRGEFGLRAPLWSAQNEWYGDRLPVTAGAIASAGSKGILFGSNRAFGVRAPSWILQNGWYDRDDTLLATGGAAGSVGLDGNNLFGSDTAVAGAGSSYSLTPQVLSTAGGNSATLSPNWLSVTETPEPNTILLFGTGLALLGVVFRRKLLPA